MSLNQFGKTSKLDLVFQNKQEKTLLSHLEFTAPFKVMKPFYDEKNHPSVMMMNSSAGIMAGDRQEISVTVEENAWGKIFGQSYEKIHKMEEGHGDRICKIQVKSGGFCHFAPLPAIPYGGANFRGNTEIFLEDTSAKLIFSEIFSCGRVAMGELFQYTAYDSEIRVQCGQELIYRDKLKYRPSEMNLSGFCHQEGFTHQSTLICFHIPDISLEKIDSYLETLTKEQAKGGYSHSHSGGLVFRFLGNSGEILEKIHSEVAEILLSAL